MLEQAKKTLKTAKSWIPPSLAGAVSNCGGTNFRRDRFAGNLLEPNLSEERFLGICHSLIFPNGVRKTTAPGRNSENLKALLQGGHLVLKERLRVLDIGASLGVDSLATHRLLSVSHQVDEYVLGDLYPRVLYDPERGLVFDEDGNLLQVKERFFFVAIHFSYNYWFQRLFNLPKQLLPWFLQQRHRFSASPQLVPIPLIHPSIDLHSAGTPFRIKRLNVFEPLGQRFDLIVCMHLLVDRYFSAAVIEQGVRNLGDHLEVGGSLVVGSKESFQVVTRKSADAFSTRSFP